MPSELDKFNKAERDFLTEYTRVHLMEWCCQTISQGRIMDVRAAAETVAQKTTADFCLILAREKSWVSQSDPPKVLARGFAVAESFLKR